MSLEIIPTKVKWGKENFEMDMVVGDGVAGFKAKLEEKTGVPRDRMKLMAKSKGLWKGVLKDDIDLSTLNLAVALKKSNPIQILLMGSATLLVAPKTKTVFLEDLKPDEAAKAMAEPAGLVNLGNTCYLNSVTQCLRRVPTLRSALTNYRPPQPDPNTAALTRRPTSNADHSNLLYSLRDLYTDLENTGNAVPPARFVMATKRAFPQFGQTNAQGQPMQQDAEEFFSGMLAIMASEMTGMESIQRGFQNQSVTKEDLNGADNFVDASFGLKMEETLTCDEFTLGETSDHDKDNTTMTEVDNSTPSHVTVEPAVKSFDLHRKLVCNIQGGSDGNATVNVNHVQEGIALALNGKIEKHSDVLGRNAVWTRKQRIARLPPVLVVQFGRFYWKATPNSQDHAGVKCKVMKPVSFNDTMDVYEFCSDSAQKILKVHRDAAIKEEEERLSNKESEATEKKDGDDDATMEDAVPTEEKVDEEAAELQAALEMSMEPETRAVGPGLPDKFQGMYELFGVVTHKGRNADGGHYMGWVRMDDGVTEEDEKKKKDDTDTPVLKKEGEPESELSKQTWFVFDDDEVTACTGEEVMKLKGGGDYHMSYLNFYRAKK